MVTLLNRDSAPGKWRDRGLPAFAEPPSCKNYGEPGATPKGFASRRLARQRMSRMVSTEGNSESFREQAKRAKIRFGANAYFFGDACSEGN
jgi:hypothetical protein